MRNRVWPILRAAFGLVGVTFLALVLVRTVRRLGVDTVPSWPSFVAAGVLSAGSIMIGARGWASLFDEGSSDLRRGFYASQLGKYIPGGIWQSVALVGSASRSGASLRHSTVRLPVYMVTTIVAGATVGAALSIVGTSVPSAARWGSLAGLATLPLLTRRWMMTTVRLFRRISKQPTSEEDLIPPRGAIQRSYLFNLGSVLAGSMAFAVLLGSLHTRVSSIEAVTGFCLAWIAGFVAVPVPSGIGVREAILIGLFESGIEGPVVAAAVAQRIVAIVAELIVVLAASGARRSARRS